MAASSESITVLVAERDVVMVVRHEVTVTVAVEVIVDRASKLLPNFIEMGAE